MCAWGQMARKGGLWDRNGGEVLMQGRIWGVSLAVGETRRRELKARKLTNFVSVREKENL